MQNYCSGVIVSAKKFCRASLGTVLRDGSMGRIGGKECQRYCGLTLTTLKYFIRPIDLGDERVFCI